MPRGFNPVQPRMPSPSAPALFCTSNCHHEPLHHSYGSGPAHSEGVSCQRSMQLQTNSAQAGRKQRLHVLQLCPASRHTSPDAHAHLQTGCCPAAHSAAPERCSRRRAQSRSACSKNAVPNPVRTEAKHNSHAALQAAAAAAQPLPVSIASAAHHACSFQALPAPPHRLPPSSSCSSEVSRARSLGIEPYRRLRLRFSTRSAAAGSVGRCSGS